MRRARAFVLALFALAAVARAAHASGAAAAREATFATGADVSSLPQVEAGGGAFRLAGEAANALAALRAAGIGAVRLRVWHSPADGACGPAAAVAMSRRARALGLRVMLDLHFSDTWADPGRQSPPTAWRGLPLPVLADSVRAWTRDVLAACVAAGATPEWVQLGNEVDDGLLWETGRLGANDMGWDALAALLNAAGVGAREGAPGVKRIVHFSRGGDPVACGAFFGELARRHVPFEIAGLSYYPWWHGTLTDLRRALRLVAASTGRDVMVVETASPWTLRALDATHNVVGEPRHATAWPASPEGQAAFARAVRVAVRSVPGGRGVGAWWWEPAWIATPGHGSSWENCTLFDSSGTALPALRAFTR